MWVEPSRVKSSTLIQHLVEEAIEKGAFGLVRE